MNKFTFETGIELPSTETHFRKMKPGDSVFLPRPYSHMLYREFIAECKRKNWPSVDLEQTRHGFAGIMVWRLYKPRTAYETEESAIMRRVRGLLCEEKKAMTTLDIAKKCLAFGRLGKEKREKIMTDLVEWGYCTAKKSEKTTRYIYSTAYWYRERQ